MVDTRSKGNIGEDFAVKVLQKMGYKILQRNFRSKLGEIDIITKDHDYISFVEVKTRWNKKFGKPEESVTPRKIQRLKKVIDFYLLTHTLKLKKQKIEVFAIDTSEDKISFKIFRVD
jgi:putative endonuclease